MRIAGHVGEICRIWLLIALVAAAVGKSIAFGRFHRDLAASFPELGAATRLVAAAIVAIEALLALALLGGEPVRHYGLIGTAMLFAALTAVAGIALAQDRTVICSCFGGASHRVSGYDLLRNGLLIAAAVFGALAPPLSGVDGFAHVALAGIALILFQLSAGLRDIAAVLRIRT